jgi:hypothetical protein
MEASKRPSCARMGDMILNHGTPPASARSLVALLESKASPLRADSHEWRYEERWLDHTLPLLRVVPEGGIAYHLHIWGPQGHEAQVAWCSWLSGAKARVKTPVFEVVPDEAAYDGKTRLRFNGMSSATSLKAIVAAIESTI